MPKMTSVPQNQAAQQRDISASPTQANASPQSSDLKTEQKGSVEERSQSQGSSAVFVNGPDSLSSSGTDSLSTPFSSTTRNADKPQSSLSATNNQSALGRASSRSPSSPSLPAQPTAKVTERNAPRITTEGQEPRRCWICLLDETDDNVVDSEWRSPCACALTAHESCLLNWIASIEAPGSRARSGFAAVPTSAFGAAPILCPQCKTEIVVLRRRSFIVDAVNSIRTVNRILALPAVALISCATIYQGLFMHGVGTVYTIFGTREGEALLEPLYAAHHGFHAGRSYTAWDSVQLAVQNWRYNLGLPTIPTVLVFSRTTMLDLAIPMVPLVFLLTGQNSDQLLSLQWPPTPALTFALLPYLRGMYNGAYERLWREREKKWMKELEPQTQNDGNAGNDNQDDNGENRAEAEANAMAAEDDDDEAMEGNVEGFQLEVGLEWLGDGAEGLDAPAQAPAPDRLAHADTGLEAEADIPQAQEIPNPDGNHPRAQNQGQDQEPRQRAQQAQQPGLNQANANANANAIHVNAHDLASTVIGALIFPGIAAISGEILRLVLPASLTSSPASSASSTFSSSSSLSSSSSYFSSPSTSLFSSFSSNPDNGKSGLWTSWFGLGIFAPVKSPGLLQQRWGRSVVGGCLFVVLKDALMLYVKWRMARMQRNRKVLDYDKRKGGKAEKEKEKEKERKRSGERRNRDRGNGSRERRTSGSSGTEGDAANPIGSGSARENSVEADGVAGDVGEAGQEGLF